MLTYKAPFLLTSDAPHWLRLFLAPISLVRAQRLTIARSLSNCYPCSSLAIAICRSSRLISSLPASLHSAIFHRTSDRMTSATETGPVNGQRSALIRLSFLVRLRTNFEHPCGATIVALTSPGVACAHNLIDEGHSICVDLSITGSESKIRCCCSDHQGMLPRPNV